MKVEKIGLLGFGTVGSGVYHILTKHQASIEKKTGVSLQIEKALVKEPELFEDQIPGITFTSDVDYILNDEEISIIVEVLGGVDFAFNCVKKALESGKHVVTANKDLLAKHGVELSQIARENNVYLYYEASVGGGIPVLRPLVEHVASNEVESIYGIVNGTTNFILTSMSQQGLSYEEVLKVAQEKGFAEADPTSDVEGYDATYKLIILTRVAFGTNVSFDAIPKKGITQVTKTDLQLAKLAKEKEAIGTYLSGAGPTVMVLSSKENASSIAQHLQEQLPSKLGNYEIRVLTVDQLGVRVEKR